MQKTLPPVLHHELGQVHHQNIAGRLLAAAANIRDDRLHGVTVRRINHRQRHRNAQGVPALLHDLQGGAVVVNSQRLNRGGATGTRIREGANRRAAHTLHVHDGVHTRRQGRHIRNGFSVQGDVQGGIHRIVVAASHNHTSNHQGNHSKGEPRTGGELRHHDGDQHRGGHHHAHRRDRNIAQQGAARHLCESNTQQAHAVAHHRQLHQHHGQAHAHDVQLNQRVHVRAENGGEEN